MLGPGTLSVDTKKGYTFHTTHWFDGLTVSNTSSFLHTPFVFFFKQKLNSCCINDQMMHKFVIEDGKVLYANKKAAREVENYIAKYGGWVLYYISHINACYKITL